MSCLIIPDVHEKIVLLKKIVDKYYTYVDRIVALGDFYDTFDPLDLRRVGQVAEYDAHMLNDPKWTRIMGNHCIQYAFPEIYELKCSGYHGGKLMPIQAHMTDKHWGKVKFHTWEKGWLLSHAGIHEAHSPPDGYTKDFLATKEKSVCYQLMFERDPRSNWLHAGRERGGNQKTGGIIWLDFEREFQPVQNINQIVGHTRSMNVRTNHSEAMNSKNYCIDADLGHVAIIEDDGTVRTEATF